MRKTVLTATFLALTTTAALAAPKGDRQWADCMSDDAAKSIRGCTEVLARGSRVSDRTRAGAHFNRGIEHAKAGRHQEALADFGAAASLRLDSARPFVEMMQVHRRMGNLDLALVEINKAVSREPDNADVYFHRADLLDDRGELEEALSDLDRAIAKNPAYGRAYNLRGLIMNKQKRYPRAIREFNIALQQEPQMAVVYGNRAWSFSQMGELELALADYDYAIQLAPDRPNVLNGRGLVHGRMGNIDLALADFNRAIRLDPRFRAARENRVDMLLRKKDCRTAMPELDALIAEQSKPLLLAFRGTCQGSLGNLAAALLDFNAALAREPELGIARSGHRKAEAMLAGTPPASF